MNYRVICTDIDGTLLGKNRELSEQTIREINRIKKQIIVILVSSRMPSAMRHIQKTLGIEQTPIIAYNGGLVIMNEGEQKVFLSTPILFNIPPIIHNQIQGTNIHTSLYYNDDWYVETIDFWATREINNTRVYPIVTDFANLLLRWKNNKEGPHKIMCMGDEKEINHLEQFLKTSFFENLNIYRSKPTYLEIVSKQASKAAAITALLNHMGYSLNETVAFGDNFNDIEMLEVVGLGIAVSNGNDQLKSVADEITLSNIEDGVAVSIKKHFKI